MHKSGHCQCGKIQYQVTGDPKWTALCHCESCRRACSAPIVAWMGFDPKDVEWSGERTFYKSSDIATRGFCNTCGTQMSFEAPVGLVKYIFMRSRWTIRKSMSHICIVTMQSVWIG